MVSHYNLRALAARILNQVIDQGQSLTAIFPHFTSELSDRDRSLLQELSFGCLRTLPQLECYLGQLMAKPLTGKQRTVHFLLIVGFYQLLYTRIPPHAAVAETVNGAIALKRPQLKGLINGVLREFQRQQDMLQEKAASNDSRFLHPQWLLKRLQKAYPEEWLAIVEANNQKPPMWLRVNRQHYTTAEYLALLQAQSINAFEHPDYPDALRLEQPCPVSQLPGFEQGCVTIQDIAAQGCVSLLGPKSGERILDLCAAPGGKTTHILEAAPGAQVLAIDIDEERLKRVKENLTRLNLQAEVKQGDATKPELWCEQPFDRILLDAPCSATGVIRRHPDIKWLRRESDIASLVTLQWEILNAIWPFLKPGGTLLYATCSVLPEENVQQIRGFLKSHPDAQLSETGDDTHPGIQLLPVLNQNDGFYYAKLMKKSLG